MAIVILNYNGRHHLENFLPSVIASTYPNKKVYVADNASTDDSTIWVQQNHPEVEVITLKENYGFARGYNVALKQVEADYYCLLNSDVEVTRGWIEPVIALMQTNKKIAACQPKILSYHNRRMFEYAGACGGWIDSLGYPFSRGRVFDVCEEDKGQYDRTSQIFWASGAALFVKASAFQHMQGFDEYFFAHQEEIDLCWRMQLAGYTVMVCPASVVYHVGAGTLPKGGRKIYLNFRNNLVMIFKNLPADQLIWKLPLRIALDIIAAIKSLITGDVSVFKGVFQALFSFARWLASSKKDNNFSDGSEGKLMGVYRGSIVWEYFINRKKTFVEIVGKTD